MDNPLILNEQGFVADYSGIQSGYNVEDLNISQYCP